MPGPLRATPGNPEALAISPAYSSTRRLPLSVREAPVMARIIPSEYRRIQFIHAVN